MIRMVARTLRPLILLNVMLFLCSSVTTMGLCNVASASITQIPGSCLEERTGGLMMPSDRSDLKKALALNAPSVRVAPLGSFCRGRTVIVVYDCRGTEFCMKRLQAFQSVLPELTRKNINVIGLSVDNDLSATAEWAKSIGVTFPLVIDTDGTICRSLDLLNEKKMAAERAFLVVDDGNVQSREIVDTTDLPPIIEQILRG